MVSPFRRRDASAAKAMTWLSIETSMLVSASVLPEAIRSQNWDNDVVDHQTVNMAFANNIYATFTMTAFTETSRRTIKITGTLGELEGARTAPEPPHDVLRIQETAFAVLYWQGLPIWLSAMKSRVITSSKPPRLKNPETISPSLLLSMGAAGTRSARSKRSSSRTGRIWETMSCKTP